jgi:plastocyanin
MTKVRVLLGVLAVVLVVGSAVGCGQAADKSKQEAKKKGEAKAQQAKQEANKKVQAKEQQAKNQAKEKANAKKQQGKKKVEAKGQQARQTAKKLEPKKQDVIKTVAIKESDFKLSPSRVTLSKPGTYAFKAENNSSVQHSLEIEGKGVKSEGGEAGEAKLEQALNPGQSGVLTVSFQKSGTYEMYCPVDGHEQMGMKGKIVVS